MWPRPLELFPTGRDFTWHTSLKCHFQVTSNASTPWWEKTLAGPGWRVHFLIPPPSNPVNHQNKEWDPLPCSLSSLLPQLKRMEAQRFYPQEPRQCHAELTATATSQTIQQSKPSLPNHHIPSTGYWLPHRAPIAASELPSQTSSRAITGLASSQQGLPLEECGDVCRNIGSLL